MTEFSFPPPSSAQPKPGQAGGASNGTDGDGFYKPPAGGTTEERLANLEKVVQALEHAAARTEDPLRPVLLAGANSNGTWSELTIVSGNITTPSGVGWRGCTSTGDPSKILPLTGNQTVLLEVPDKGNHYYVPIGAGPAAKITSVASGSTPGPWVYNGVNPSGANITIKNTMEPCNGSPGPLGVTVSANGTVGSGTCIIQPIGNMTNFCPAYVDANGTYWLTIPNSAQ